MPVVLALYSYMVTARQMDPAVLMAHDSPNQLPAQVGLFTLPCKPCAPYCSRKRNDRLMHWLQMEVIFASLWSVGSWRGIYAGLRPYI